ncbi:MAG: ATP-binding cassette domain-containing protein [Acidobacteriota bacterium]
MSRIVFNHVRKSYGGKPVLENFSMTVEPGRCKVILGGGGSGKSTVLKIIPRLILPDSGSVFIDDNEISALTEDEMMPIRSRIGMVFQEGALFDSLTVLENVAYRLREHTTQLEKTIRDSVMEALGFVGLEDAAERMPSELSGGMRRRVAIARAMVGNPRIILYDEPTAGLDPINSRSICNLVMGLRDLKGVTSVMVTNDLDAARILAAEKVIIDKDGREKFVDQIISDGANTDYIVLHEGEIRLEGTQEDLQNSGDSYIREFLD